MIQKDILFFLSKEMVIKDDKHGRFSMWARTVLGILHGTQFSYVSRLVLLLFHLTDEETEA